MGRPPLLRDHDKIPDNVNLSLPHGYKHGKLKQIRAYFGMSINHLVHLALEELWERRNGPSSRAVERLGGAGLIDLIPDYRQHDFSQIIREAKHLMLRTADIGAFYTANRQAFLDRLRSPDLSTLVIIIKRPNEVYTTATQDFIQSARQLTASLDEVDHDELDAPVFSRITLAVVSFFGDAPLFALWTESALYSTCVTEALSPEAERTYPSYALVWRPGDRLNDWHYTGANLASYERFFPTDRIVHRVCRFSEASTEPNIMLYKSFDGMKMRDT
ncbi:hypothetical protein GFL93_09465 [Rhizobium leguminosarum bv. viciae]|uniref:hypothetical protein n=1 Tax=Rhizobium TaxID=379 RepID=UPI001441715C|nr:hypothetical protein [Rhizobium leguminosarum]NKK06099.1 hypothetical protein [Rhizobium leguminosarum bv. viciae]